jgi:hypothetical protein
VLSSYPNPYDTGESYMVYFRYYNAEGKNGLINIFPENSNPLDTNYNDFSKATVLHQVVSSNTSDNITIQYHAGYGCNNLIVLYVNTGALSYDEVARIWEYYTPSIPLQNTIYVSGNDPHIIPSSESYIPINIYGSHQYFGFDVYVTLNGKRVYPSSIGLERNFAFWYNVSKEGIYNASLRIATTNGSTLLASVLFNVQYEGYEQNPSGNWDWVKDLIPPGYRIFVGIGIMVMFALLPIAFLGAVQKKVNHEIKLPDLVMETMSVSCAIIGFVLCIIWGLLEWWTVFLLLFVLILVFAIAYYTRKPSGNS